MANLDELCSKISDIVSDYANEVQEKLEEKLSETANKINEYIKMNTPRSGRGSTLADNFVITKKGDGKNVSFIIHNSKKGRLVHLIEFGFEHRSGKFVAARPFMKPAYDEFTPKMLEDIIRIIEGKD